MGASGLGALIGALSLAVRNKVYGLGRWVAVSTAAFGVSLIPFSLSHSFWLSAALLLPVGLSMMIEMAASNTLIQAMVPDNLRGRVMAVYSMMFMGMAPIGALVAGSLANRLGAPRTVLLGGAVCIVGAAIFALRLPKLREEGRRLIIALQMTGGSPAVESTGEASALTSRD
jgi:MFS family permease